jgi:hypothetical protein
MMQVARELQELGHEIVSRWVRGAHDIPDDGITLSAPAEVYAQFAEEDIDDLWSADCVIAFTEPPNGPARGGRHVEFGMALALEEFGNLSRLICVGHQENVFYCLTHVEFYENWDEAKQALGAENQACQAA